GVPLVAATGIALGHGLAAVVGAWLIEQVARGPHAFERGGHVALYAAVTTLVSATLSTLAVIAALAATSHLESGVLERAGLAWWWADVTATIVVAPALVLWSLRPRLSLTRR